jgi:hypothetical protein
MGGIIKHKKPEEAIAGSGGKEVFYVRKLLRKLNNYAVS